jgi:cytochrome P450
MSTRPQDQPAIVREEPIKAFVLSRYAEGRAFLADNSLLRDADLAEPGAYVHAFKTEDPRRPGDRNCAMGWLDGADHARVRGPIAQAFYKRVAAARPAVQRIVDERLDRLGGRDRFDLVAEFAVPVPVDVIADLFGVEPGALPRFREWSEGLMKVFDPTRTEAESAEVGAAWEGFNTYLEAAIAERRHAPRDDLISDLAAPGALGGALSQAEIRVNCLNLLAGGNMTTADLIASSLWRLLRHPGPLAALRAEPARIGAVIEEALRLEPPVDATQRILAEDRLVAGCPVRRGQVVAVSIAAANRDPRAFADPDRFDIDRPRTPHLAFGGGSHMCIGAPLARLQAQVAVLAVIDRFPGLRLAEPQSPPKWRATPSFHGLETLRVET